MLESGDAAVLQPDGRVTYDDGSLIVGPALDGSGVGGNTEAWFDEDGGRYDGDTVYERGVGPFGMMPTTWIGLGEPGDPHNLADAAAGAARLLCEQKGYSPTDQAEAPHRDQALQRHRPERRVVRRRGPVDVRRVRLPCGYRYRCRQRQEPPRSRRTGSLAGCWTDRSAECSTGGARSAAR